METAGFDYAGIKPFNTESDLKKGVIVEKALQGLPAFGS